MEVQRRRPEVADRVGRAVARRLVDEGTLDEVEAEGWRAAAADLDVNPT